MRRQRKPSFLRVSLSLSASRYGRGRVRVPRENPSYSRRRRRRECVRGWRTQGCAGGVSKADNPSGVFLFLLRRRPTLPRRRHRTAPSPQPSLSSSRSFSLFLSLALCPFYRVSPRVIVVVAAREDETGGRRCRRGVRSLPPVGGTTS